MKYKIFKRCTKNFAYVFTKTKRTEEIEIDLGNNVGINIYEHQFGEPLATPWITISKGNTSYNMDLPTFLEKFFGE